MLSRGLSGDGLVGLSSLSGGMLPILDVVKYWIGQLLRSQVSSQALQ